LLPKGIVKKISRPMLEALMAHEFAHIRRRDNVVNLIQTVVENLFFFHPVVWWASSRVRAEREACCDDDAVAICGDRVAYVRALSQAEQFRSSLPVTALCSSPLLQRIRRLTEMKKSKSSFIPNFCIALLAVSFMIVTATGSILLATIPPQDSNKPETKATNAAPQEQKKVAQPKAVVVDPKQFTSKGIVGGIPGGISGGLREKGAAPPPPPPKNEDAVKLIRKVDPIFPDLALKARVSGKVVLKLKVNEEGAVSDVQVVSGHPLLNEASIDAVRQWKYSPPVKIEAPVDVTVTIVFGYDKNGAKKIIAPAPSN
jgi:TonB family protein